MPLIFRDKKLFSLLAQDLLLYSTTSADGKGRLGQPAWPNSIFSVKKRIEDIFTDGILES